MYITKSENRYIININNHMLKTYSEYDNEEDAFKSLEGSRDFILVSILLKDRLSKKDKEILNNDISVVDEMIKEREYIKKYLSEKGISDYINFLPLLNFD